MEQIRGVTTWQPLCSQACTGGRHLLTGGMRLLALLVRRRVERGVSVHDGVELLLEPLHKLRRAQQKAGGDCFRPLAAGCAAGRTRQTEQPVNTQL